MTTVAATALLPFTDNYIDLILRRELAEVNRRHPGWHAYLSDERRSWAVHTRRSGGGITLDAPSPSLLDHVITAWEHTGGLEVLAS